MATRRKQPRQPAAIPPMPDYAARTLGYSVTALTILVGLWKNYFGVELLWLVGAALVWPHLLHAVIRYGGQQKNLRLRQSLLVFDAFVCGLILILMNFSLGPSLFLLLMLNFSFIIVGGMQVWLYGVMAGFAGLIIGSLLFGVSMTPPTPPLVTVAAGLGTMLYVCITAYFVHEQAEALVAAKTQIHIQREQSLALSHKLAKYLSPQVWQSIFTGERDVRLETQRKKLVIFFSDIKGFTELSEEMEPESLTELLNTYFTEMSQIALKYGGTIDKFVGDSIMIFYGDPSSRGSREDTLSCVAMAIEMRRHMNVMRQKWASMGIRTPLQIRMGISTGYCTVGNFGAENRMDYTIIGKEVNLASRLESMAEANQILVSYETFALIKDTIMCRDKGHITVKGFARPVPIYEVVDFRRDLGANQSFIEHESDGFALYLDTDKVGTHNREDVADMLENAARKLRNKIMS